METAWTRLKRNWSFISACAFGIGVCVILGHSCTAIRVNQNARTEMSRNMGALVMALARSKAPDYVSEIEMAGDKAFAALESESVDLGGTIGDLMAVVQGLGAFDGAQKYMQIVQDASAFFMGVVRLDWDTPENFEEARVLVQAFLEGMGK
jgi:hypothetical protein